MPTADAVFDPLAEGFAASPYEQCARLRELDPVHRSELLCGWVVTRFDDVSALLRDPTISSSIHNATPTPLTVHEIERLSEQPRAARTIVMADDPDHARIRRLMADPFRPRQVEVLRQRITERVAAALDLMAQLVTLYMAGHEPTAALIGAGTLALLGAPDQLARVRAERGLRRGAVSELLRHDGPNQFVRRITTRPTRIGEVELPPGAVVYASPASANRDPRRWGATPTGWWSTDPTPGHTSSSAPGHTPAWARTSPACRPRSPSTRCSTASTTSSWPVHRSGAPGCSSVA